MNKDIAFNNLKDFTNLLSFYTKNWWLEAGTCLGAYREGGFIGHDTDTDIGVFAEDFSWSFVYDIQFLHGFKIKHVFGLQSCGFEIAFIRGDIKIDLFLFYKKGDKRWMAAWSNGGRNGMTDIIKLVFDAELIENIGMIDFMGIPMNIPQETEKYLIARYGEDWRIPTHNWNWATDPKCINNDFEV